MAHRVVRIAHAHGNDRNRLAQALAAPVDLIEADIWHRGGEFSVHHDRRLNPFPILADRRVRSHERPAFSLPLWNRYYVRPDFRTLKLTDLLAAARGRKRLLLDLKGRPTGPAIDTFAKHLARRLREAGAVASVEVCGQFHPVLDSLRGAAPETAVRYSIEHEYQWRKLVRLVEERVQIQGICIAHRFLDESRATFCARNDINVFCWTVDDPTQAQALVARGVHGIISNDLGLLAALP